MPGLARSIALTVAMLLTPLACKAAGVDCWLMDEAKRAESADQGLCQDAFARTGKPNAPPVVVVPTAPIPAEKPPPPVKRPPRGPAPVAVASSGSSLSASSSMESRGPSQPRGFDFLGNLRRDLNSVLDLLADGSGGSRPTRGQRSAINER